MTNFEVFSMVQAAISYPYRWWISIYSSFKPMGKILRLQRHWQIAEISVKYHNIGGGVGGGTASKLIKTP
jgi:hypothetical protein